MKITMGHRQAAHQITQWYLFHYRVLEAYVEGAEIFTLFDKLKADDQDRIRNMLRLKPFENPVLIFTICEGQYIINTSERFVNITPVKKESVYYKDFDGFAYYESLHYVKKKRQKTDAPVTYIELGLKKKNGAILFWKIPSDNSGFFFWNVTRLIEGIKTKNQKTL